MKRKIPTAVNAKSVATAVDAQISETTLRAGTTRRAYRGMADAAPRFQTRVAEIVSRGQECSGLAEWAV